MCIKYLSLNDKALLVALVIVEILIQALPIINGTGLKLAIVVIKLDIPQALEKLIKAFVVENPKVEYMDASISMLEENGEVRKDIFVEDGLHMNAKGYEGWTNQLKPILEKIYELK